jgi:hypothetical protein
VTVLAIDPGDVESGYALICEDTRRPLRVGIEDNATLLQRLWDDVDLAAGRVAIEMIASYGMPVGETVFETCVWIGKFEEASLARGRTVSRIKRLPVKMHHCHDSKAKDGNVIQALVDRFASGTRNRGKGTIAEPGWFYGFAGDMWQAYALAVYVADGAA